MAVLKSTVVKMDTHSNLTNGGDSPTELLQLACKRGDVSAIQSALSAGASDYKTAYEIACEHSSSAKEALEKYVAGYLRSLGNAARTWSARYWLDFNSRGLIGLCRRGDDGAVKRELGRHCDGRTLILYTDCIYGAAYHGHTNVVKLLVADARFTTAHTHACIAGAITGGHAHITKLV